MNKRCIGCGKILQDQDKSSEGYTPNLKNEYCMRCFRLKNYGEKKEGEIVLEKDILTRVNKGKGIAFFLVDFLNINQETIHLFNKIKLPKILVISKSDMLRREMNQDKIRIWLDQVYQVDKVLYISNKPSFKSNNIFKIMEEYNTYTAYIMGLTNAGKSTFLNKLLKEAGIKKEILASNKPNTTLDFIKIKIGEYTIFDTPGFSYQNDSLALLNKEIKPISYQIKPNTRLIINDLELFFKEENKVIFYGSTKIERKYQETPQLVYKINVSANQDIVLPGIGFLNVKNACQILSNEQELETRIDISEVKYE